MANKQIKIDLIVDGKNAVATIKNASAVTRALGKQAQTTSAKLSNIGNIATGIKSSMSLVGGFVDTMGNVVGKYTEFESGIKNVNTLLRVEDSQLEIMEDRLISISKDTGEGLSKLADATYQAVSAGYSMEEALNLVEISSRAAVAGITDTEVAVDGITTVLNAFHLEATDGTKAADLMFKTVERGKTTFPELASNLSKVSSLAYSTGISFGEISAATATLTKQGTPTSEAMTQIKASIVSMNKVLGDGWADTMTYQEGLKAVADKAGGSQNELKKLLGTDEAVNAALKLTGDNAQMASEDLDAMTESVGAMGAAYDIQTDTIEFKTKRLSAAWDTLAVSFIGSFSEPISNLLDSVADGVNGLGIIYDNFAEGFENADIEWYKFTNPLLIADDILDEISKVQEDIVVSQDAINEYTKSLTGTTKEWRAEELGILSTKWDIVDAQIMSGELEGNALYQAKTQLELLRQQAIAIKDFGKVEPKKPDGGNGKGNNNDKTEAEIKSAKKAADAKVKAAQKLDDAKEKFFLAELNRQEKIVFQEKASSLSLTEINNALLKEKTSNSEIVMNLKDAESQKAFEQLKTDKDISDSKIEILRDEQAKALAERGSYWESAKFISDEYMAVQLQQIQDEYNAQVEAGVSKEEAYALMMENKKAIDEKYIEWLSEQDEIMRQIKSDYFSDVTFMDDEYLQKQLEDIQTLYDERVASGVAEKDAYATMLQDKESLEKRYYDFKWAQIRKDNALFDGAVNAMDRGWSTFIGSLTNSAMTGSERITMVWEQMKQMFVQAIGDMVATWIAEKISTAIFGASMQATEVGKAVATGSAIAGAYAPAASMVSLATYGTNSIAAMSGISATTTLAATLASIPAFKDGVRDLREDTFALVGEEGPEFVRLPKGSDVYTNNETKIINQILEEEKRSGALPLFVDENGELNNYTTSISNEELNSSNSKVDIANVTNNSIVNNILDSQESTAQRQTPIIVSNDVDLNPLLEAINEQTERLEAVERTLNIAELDNHLTNYKMEQGEVGSE